MWCQTALQSAAVRLGPERVIHSVWVGAGRQSVDADLGREHQHRVEQVRAGFGQSGYLRYRFGVRGAVLDDRPSIMREVICGSVVCSSPLSSPSLVGI